MALTIAAVSGVKDTVIGNKRMKVRKVTFDSSYTTAGLALTAKNADLRVIEQVIPNGPFRSTDDTSSVIGSYDHTSGKLVAYWGNAGSASVSPEVTSTTDLSTYSARVTFIGY